MKLLVVIFATVLIAQLAHAADEDSSPNSMVESYEDLQYIGK